MNIERGLRIAFVYLIGVLFFLPSYGQEYYDWNRPICIASDTGLGGPRYIETNLPLNEVAPAQVIEFTLRCKGDVPIYVQTMSGGGGGAGIFARRITEDYRPTEAKFDVITNVIDRKSNEIQKSFLSVFNVSNSQSGKILHIPALGSGEHELLVRIEMEPKILKSSVIPEHPQKIAPFYQPLFSVVDDTDAPMSSRYAPYPVFLVSTFDTFPDPCVTPGPNVVAPTEVDYGALNREDLDQGVVKHFFFRMARDPNDNCGHNLYPIITFTATDPVINDEIYLKNGTILSLEDTLEYGKIKFNIPTRYGELGPNGLLNLRIAAKLRRNPDNPLIGGDFSTVVIYHVEYR